jgi:hypothetical protein
MPRHDGKNKDLRSLRPRPPLNGFYSSRGIFGVIDDQKDLHCCPSLKVGNYRIFTIAADGASSTRVIVLLHECNVREFLRMVDDLRKARAMRNSALGGKHDGESYGHGA